MSVGRSRALIQGAILGSFVLGVLVGNIQQITEPVLGRWIIAAVVTAILATLAVDALWFLRIRNFDDRPLSVPGAIAVMVTVGVMFAFAQWATTEALNLTLQRDPWLSAFSAVVGVTVVGVAVILFTNGRRQELQRRTALLDQGIAVSLARQDVSEIAQRMQMALEADIDDALAPTRRSIAERLGEQERLLTDDEWGAVAQQLRQAANDTVRPLSRSLWSRTAARLEPIRAGAVLRNIITKQPFRPLALCVIYVIGSVANVVSAFGWLTGSASLLTGVMLIVLITSTANIAMRRWPMHHAAIFIAGTLALQLGGLLSFPIRQWVGMVPYTWGEFFLGAVVGTLVVLLTSGVGSLRTHRDDVARTFQSDIDRELVESVAASRQVAQLARESARVLHGTVQTRLIACAVVIERAAETSDVNAFQSALQEANAVLTAPTRQDTNDSATLLAEVDRKVTLWSGLCVIDVVIAPELREVSGRMARDVGRVVEEGLSNAVRHGGASHIEVAVRKNGAGIVVVIKDDGTGPVNVIPGLGSALLDSVSEEWALTQGAAGARLEVLLR